jgi:CMP-N-acetylneuraminic acid synthetase
MNNNRNKRIVALLPMKAHSSRVPGKNFRDFRGKPLFRWILDTLLEIEEIDQVVINTDARSLLDQLGLPKSDRILIRDRKPGICGDDVSMNLVIQDDVQNIPADLYLMTHTTNPLLSSVTIRKALTFFYDKCALCEADSLFSVNKVQTRFYKADASPVNHDPANLIPTQDLEPWFEENSSLYVFTADSFNQTKARIGSKPVLFETPSLESLDIDTPGDWDLALLGAELLSVK